LGEENRDWPPRKCGRERRASARRVGRCSSCASSRRLSPLATKVGRIMWQGRGQPCLAAPGPPRSLRAEPRRPRPPRGSTGAPAHRLAIVGRGRNLSEAFPQCAQQLALVAERLLEPLPLFASLRPLVFEPREALTVPLELGLLPLSSLAQLRDLSTHRRESPRRLIDRRREQLQLLDLGGLLGGLARRGPSPP